jgi:glycosyltransferase involved in cell wall biosynthesis
VPLRVAIDATPLLGVRTGVGRFVEGLLGQLATRDDLDLLAYGLTWKGRKQLPSEVPAGVRVTRAPMPAAPLLRAWSRVDGPTAEWWTGAVDVVHGTNFVVPPTRRAAAVVSVHDLTAVRFPELCTPTARQYPELIRRAIRSGAWVQTASAFVEAEIIDLLGADPDRVRAIHYGLTVGTAAAELPAPGPPTILALGTIEPRKDLPLLVAAFDAVAADHPDVRLVVAGADGWGAGAFHAAVAAAHHGERIQRLGWVSEEQRNELLRQATVFAYPSVYEGFGFPPLEAMAAGIPVVSTATGSLPEVLGDGASMVPPGDRDALAAALTSLLTDEAARATLITRGRQRAAAFGWPRMAAAMVDLYQHAAAEGGVRARR